jgi:hypothetical protein
MILEATRGIQSQIVWCWHADPPGVSVRTFPDQQGRGSQKAVASH